MDRESDLFLCVYVGGKRELHFVPFLGHHRENGKFTHVIYVCDCDVSFTRNTYPAFDSHERGIRVTVWLSEAHFMRNVHGMIERDINIDIFRREV